MKRDPGEVGLHMYADFHSRTKHLSLSKFWVTMDTAHATSAVKKKNKQKNQAQEGQCLFTGESVCAQHQDGKKAN